MDNMEATLETILKSFNEMKISVEKRFDSIDTQLDEIKLEVRATKEQVIKNSEDIAEFKSDMGVRLDTVENQLDDLREGELALSDRLHDYDKQMRKLKKKALESTPNN
ncbi:hypothetical protein [Thermoactinomyces sp. DSM 45892]|uniref:hypothetical protein n=1 Tax=Thermoactinomyces sp. DSM 45892 TaxID=1882753 RepID=UPI00089D865E|nr:hypothetical protein [Thermoactinomyces sp. DSM 45892]SDY83544.1 hypothetical protein SAMN05444416_10929 [Thermoactinomyces sp. DSM 45892]